MTCDSNSVNWWEILNAATPFSRSWHRLLLTIKAQLLCENTAVFVPESSKAYYEILLNLLQRYNPAGWQANIDSFANGRLGGWAWKPGDDSSQFVTVAIDGDVVYECFLANIARHDLKESGIGTGMYGFNVAVNLERIKKPYSLAELLDPETRNLLAFRFLDKDKPAIWD